MQTTSMKRELMVQARMNERALAQDVVPGLLIGWVEIIYRNGLLKVRTAAHQAGAELFIPAEWIDSVDDKAVYLNKTYDEITEELARKPRPQLVHH